MAQLVAVEMRSGVSGLGCGCSKQPGLGCAQAEESKSSPFMRGILVGLGAGLGFTVVIATLAAFRR